MNDNINNLALSSTSSLFGDLNKPLISSKFQMSGSVNAISEALAKAQGELVGASKDNSGYGYKYSDLATVINTAKPVLAKHGLSVVQLVGETNDKFVTLTTILSHSSGQFFASTATMPIVEMKGCNLAQQAGSSLSYLRRYAYQSIIGQPSEDNDASSEGFNKQQNQSSFKKNNDEKKVSEPVKNAEETKKQPFRRSKPTVVTGAVDDL